MQAVGAGQAQPQPQSFLQQPANGLQSTNSKPIAPLIVHPNIYLDQTTKVLTLGQGEADILGQKYVLPALPFKLPATPAINSLQSLYPSKPLRRLPALQANSPSICKHRLVLGAVALGRRLSLLRQLQTTGRS